MQYSTWALPLGSRRCGFIILWVNPSRRIPPDKPLAASASNGIYVYFDQVASYTPCFQGNRNPSKSSILRPERGNCSASVFALWLVTAGRHVVIQRPMPSLEQAISSEAAALAQRRKSAIPLQREEERERGGGGFGYRGWGCSGKGTLQQSVQGGENKSWEWLRSRSQDAQSSSIRLHSLMNPPLRQGTSVLRIGKVERCNQWSLPPLPQKMTD